MGRAANADLIGDADEVLNVHVVEGPLRERRIGSVGAALVTDRGDVFRGVSIDTGSGTGFCAEHAAVAAMVTAGQYRVTKVVAVWRDNRGTVHVVPPCGRCREFIRQIDPANLDAEIVLSPVQSVTLRELLPHHQWPSTDE
jgi:cytidine deaminase